MDSIISGIKEYINSCPALRGFRGGIDWTEDKDSAYGIIPEGEKIIRKFISGGGKVQYPFTLYIKKLSKGEAEQLKNAELLETVQKWCGDNSRCGILPKLPDGCTPTKISAENGTLVEQGAKNNTYQIQFTLLYTRR